MSLYEIYFSPTGGTKKAADIIAKGIGAPVTRVDMIKQVKALKELAFEKDDLCVIAVPSYGGRVPTPAAVDLKRLKGNGAKAVLTVVFGNRAIDDTLTELQDVLTEDGFICLAGIEAVAEHSLMHQFAAGRPDKKDEKVLTGFAKEIKEKCISCMHCVAVCPKHARHYSKLLSVVAAQKMKKNCSDRKENKLYI